MKILCVADHVDPLVYSHNIKTRFGDVAAILGAGDLDIPYYEYIVSCLNKPLWFVFGNHNLKGLPHFRPSSALQRYAQASHPGTGPYYGSVYVGRKVMRDRKLDLIIAGLGGSRRYNDGENQFSEFQMFLMILGLVPKLLWNRLFRGRWLDIFLTHAPPRGIHDEDDLCHTGFAVFLWFMRAFKPKFLIHGHVHLYGLNSPRKTQYGFTTVVNAYDHAVIELETSMKDTAYIRSQADQDFAKAKQRAWVQGLKGILNPEARELLSFHDIKALVRPKKENYRGMQTVPLEAIAGSEDRYQDFSRHYFPKREHMRQRWMSIDRAYLSDINLPPIKLYKIGDIYFVRDGNHRVSVARTQGVMAIDAEVVELTADIPVAVNATREDIVAAVIAHERERVRAETDLERFIPLEDIEFTAPGRYEELMNHILGHKYFMNLDIEDEIPFSEAARSWYETIYVPTVKIIRDENLLGLFPGRTEADLYMWIVKHWHSLKDQYGPDYPLGQAAAEYAAVHGKTLGQRILKRIKALLKR